MLARLGDWVAARFRALAPDPFTIAILLTLLAASAATWANWAHHAPETSPSITDAAWTTASQWHAGLWKLLAFGMEMCLILVTGHALAASPLIARALHRLANLPKSPRQAVALTAGCAMSAALINWGFGLIVGAILARNSIDALRARRISCPAGLIAAAGYLGLMVWHGGLSGSAPLTAAKESRQIEILGPDLAARIGPIPVSETLFSTANIVTTLVTCAIALALITLMAPRTRPSSGTLSPSRERVAASSRPGEGDASVLSSPECRGLSPSSDEGHEPSPSGPIPTFLESSPIVVWAIALPALALVVTTLNTKGLAALDLGLVNLLVLSLGLILHSSARSYCAAVEGAARGCAGIILQFPLYAGIMGMIQSSGLAASLSTAIAHAAHDAPGPLGACAVLCACVVNLFVPSGGGQWAVQGPVFMDAALHAGMSPARMVMAIAYGDQLTNMLQPFWALPLLAITRVPAREIVGYTAIVMVAAIIWTCASMFIFA